MFLNFLYFHVPKFLLLRQQIKDVHVYFFCLYCYILLKYVTNILIVSCRCLGFVATWKTSCGKP